MQLLLLFFLLVSCSDRPSREKFPGPIGRTTTQRAAEGTQAVLGGFDPREQIIKIDEGNSIRGIARLGEGLKLPTKAFVIYVSARPIGGGPPLAARRMRAENLPVRFSLTESNVMIQGTEFEGFVEVTVRVDQVEADGNSDPLTRQFGDLWGNAKTKVGQQSVEITLDQVVR